MEHNRAPSTLHQKVCSRSTYITGNESRSEICCRQRAVNSWTHYIYYVGILSAVSSALSPIILSGGSHPEFSTMTRHKWLRNDRFYNVFRKNVILTKVSLSATKGKDACVVAKPAVSSDSRLWWSKHQRRHRRVLIHGRGACEFCEAPRLGRCETSYAQPDHQSHGLLQAYTYRI